MPLTPAEKQAAYRERKRLEGLAADPVEEMAEAVGAMAHAEEIVELLLPSHRPLISEDGYVRKIRREALDYSKSIGETDAPFKVGGELLRNRRSDRLVRAERYARWRYKGFLAGEIASL